MSSEYRCGFPECDEVNSDKERLIDHIYSEHRQKPVDNFDNDFHNYLINFRPASRREITERECRTKPRTTPSLYQNDKLPRPSAVATSVGGGAQILEAGKLSGRRSTGEARSRPIQAGSNTSKGMAQSPNLDGPKRIIRRNTDEKRSASVVVNKGISQPQNMDTVDLPVIKDNICDKMCVTKEEDKASTISLPSCTEKVKSGTHSSVCLISQYFAKISGNENHSAEGKHSKKCNTSENSEFQEHFSTESDHRMVISRKDKNSSQTQSKSYTARNNTGKPNPPRSKSTHSETGLETRDPVNKTSDNEPSRSKTKDAIRQPSTEVPSEQENERRSKTKDAIRQPSTEVPSEQGNDFFSDELNSETNKLQVSQDNKSPAEVIHSVEHDGFQGAINTEGREFSKGSSLVNDPECISSEDESDEDIGLACNMPTGPVPPSTQLKTAQDLSVQSNFDQIQSDESKPRPAHSSSTGIVNPLINARAESLNTDTTSSSNQTRRNDAKETNGKRQKIEELPPDGFVFEERLVLAVKKESFIDGKLCLNRKKNWTTISEAAGRPQLECQSRWKSLANRYYRYRKRPNPASCNSIYEKMNEFLKPFNTKQTCNVVSGYQVGNNDFDKELIEAVKMERIKFGFTRDGRPRKKSYSNWNKICKKLNEPRERCIVRWRHLTAKYDRHIKGRGHTLNWPHYDAMHFVQKLLMKNLKSQTKSGIQSDKRKLSMTKRDSSSTEAGITLEPPELKHASTLTLEPPELKHYSDLSAPGNNSSTELPENGSNASSSREKNSIHFPVAVERDCDEFGQKISRKLQEMSEKDRDKAKIEIDLVCYHTKYPAPMRYKYSPSSPRSIASYSDLT